MNCFVDSLQQQAAIMAAASAAGGGAYIGATPMAIATQLPPTALNGIGSPVVPSAPGQSSFSIHSTFFFSKREDALSAPPGQNFSFQLFNNSPGENCEILFKPKGEDEEH